MNHEFPPGGGTVERILPPCLLLIMPTILFSNFIHVNQIIYMT
jgi:hypothetical protein